ncbi:hypothetical protein JUJ52_08735 [Virgibacillus sp. AGTR]|uniref:hypothetical protein n=1 Tax=Virgibacillus sp. AGTR TaxID=2812055 RepID=UPI0019629526|nr:hypothetical protein [Virgibacillus sp. AGTR]MCC2250051.1 hypothetical protein [Virgibacillus sp. AGTR]QRZ17500.1 hypothetical protein JUJ52_17280 [Virgibacillus sp. AGTR]
MDKICETHGRLRCSECDYVGELEERVKELRKLSLKLNHDLFSERMEKDRYKYVNEIQKERIKELKQALEEIESRALQEINSGGQLDPEEVVEIVRQHL